MELEVYNRHGLIKLCSYHVMTPYSVSCVVQFVIMQ